jgi:hypothetical protein
MSAQIAISISNKGTKKQWSLLRNRRKFALHLHFICTPNLICFPPAYDIDAMIEVEINVRKHWGPRGMASSTSVNKYYNHDVHPGLLAEIAWHAQDSFKSL